MSFRYYASFDHFLHIDISICNRSGHITYTFDNLELTYYDYLICNKEILKKKNLTIDNNLFLI
jgi:hypothetical protein